MNGARATVAALVQPLSGDRLAKGTAHDQPEKARGGLRIPYGLSFLAQTGE